MFECSLCGNGNVVIYNEHYEPHLLLCKNCEYNGKGKYKLKSCSICWRKDTEFLEHTEFGYICKTCSDFLSAGFKFYGGSCFVGDSETFESDCQGCLFYKEGIGNVAECNLLTKIISQRNYNQIEKPELFWFIDGDIAIKEEKAVCLRKKL